MSHAVRQKRRDVVSARWVMLALCPFLLAPAPDGEEELKKAPALKPEDAAGHWEGYIAHRVVIRMDLAVNGGRWTGRAVVPSLADEDVAVTDVTVPSPEIAGGVPILAVLTNPQWGEIRFSGHLDGGDRIVGPLVLGRGVHFVDLRRVPPGRPVRAPAPWVPDAPVTYRAEPAEVRYLPHGRTAHRPSTGSLLID